MFLLRKQRYKSFKALKATVAGKGTVFGDKATELRQALFVELENLVQSALVDVQSGKGWSGNVVGVVWIQLGATWDTN